MLEGALKIKRNFLYTCRRISCYGNETWPDCFNRQKSSSCSSRNKKLSLSQKILSNIEEVYARNGKIISIANKKTPELEKFSEEIILVPETLEEFSPIINVISLQLLVYYIADLKRLDVDKPRNLAKCNR